MNRSSIAYWFLGIVAFCGCSPEVKNVDAPAWTKDLSIYEIMPRQYNEHRSLSGIAGDLDRIKSMFFNAICLLPVLMHDASNNAFNPNSAFALLSFDEIDPELGKPEDLVVLIDSAHAKGLKVITQWGFSFTGPHHPWRLSNPDYYLSADKMKDGRYNQDYVMLDLKRANVREELIRALKRYLDRFDFDGVMLYGLDHAPPAFRSELERELNQIRPLIHIYHGHEPVERGSFQMNESLFHLFRKSYEGQLKVSEFMIYLDSVNKTPKVNYVQDYLVNERHGSEVNMFYNAYKSFNTLCFFLPGMQWVLNGQEGPQFDRLSVFDAKPFSREFNFNADLYRSMNYQKQRNPALWNHNPGNFPVRISDSDDVLALERKSGEYSCVLLFNLTDKPATFHIKNDYYNYYELFNKVPLGFSKVKPLSLGPHQVLVFSNVP